MLRGYDSWLAARWPGGHLGHPARLFERARPRLHPHALLNARKLSAKSIRLLFYTTVSTRKDVLRSRDSRSSGCRLLGSFRAGRCMPSLSLANMCVPLDAGTGL